jgi:hypothetical protein
MNVNAKLVSPEVHRDGPQVQRDAEQSTKIQCERLEAEQEHSHVREPRRATRARAIEVGIAKFIHLRETMSALSGAIISSTIRVFHLAPSQVWIVRGPGDDANAVRFETPTVAFAAPPSSNQITKCNQTH